jgi:3-dehydroquinate synthase
LDFGHWAAHKLEALTGYQLSHAPAVAIGLALDTLYSVRSGLAPESLIGRVFSVLSALRLEIYHEALDWRDEHGNRRVLEGLDEFREHLGGDLTVLMLQGIGQGVDVHRMDAAVLGGCIDELHEISQADFLT